MRKKTSSDIKLKKFYGSLNNESPGDYPFTHGIYPNMYIDMQGFLLQKRVIKDIIFY